MDVDFIEVHHLYGDFLDVARLHTSGAPLPIIGVPKPAGLKHPVSGQWNNLVKAFRHDAIRRQWHDHC